jgi:hypothetical protein
MNYLQCTTALRVLDLCDHALFQLERNPEESHWLFYWFGTLAALRAVGHAVEADGHDPDCPPELKKAIEEHWNELNKIKREDGRPRHIFWDFIYRDRNLALKEFSFNAAQNIEKTSSGRRLIYVIIEGPFAGKDPREVVREAIDWWREYVREIAISAGVKAMSQGS